MPTIERWRKIRVCATEGCEVTFERNSPRHKYCKLCAEVRKEGYNKVWYNERGGAAAKRMYYQERKAREALQGEFDEHNEKGQIDE